MRTSSVGRRLPHVWAAATGLALLGCSTPASVAPDSERSAQSVAFFMQAASVIQSPRCLNCHPADRTPTQGDDLHAHVPFMQAGIAGHGPAGLTCNACHQSENVATYGSPLASVPGHPHWALAPASMAWQGKTAPEICRQLKDPELNGGRTLDEIQEHMAEDTLVGWAWHPGPHRTPAPATQRELGRWIADWIATGAACPAD